MSTGVIKKVAGPLVIAEGMRDCNMFDVVHVSNLNLIGEVTHHHGLFRRRKSIRREDRILCRRNAAGQRRGVIQDKG
ncbi:MAG: hypothetical protein II163_05565, partial [Ruminococcus sp.]|nr:hypothetical protein [Ruminococcus sp.]